MRLIDGAWLEEHLNLYVFNNRDDIRKFINDASKIDIVRCNECEHCTEDHGCKMFPDSELWFEGSYCGWGDRNNNESN